MAKASTMTRTIPIATTVFFSMMLKLLCSFIGAPAPYLRRLVVCYPIVTSSLPVLGERSWGEDDASFLLHLLKRVFLCDNPVETSCKL